MRNYSTAALAAILSVSAGLVHTPTGMLASPTRSPRKRTLGTSDEKRAKQREIAEWNAAVDARKLAKREGA